MPLLLTSIEARVIASLVEKSVTTPQYYPLTVNSLVAASNQKSSRDPAMSLSEGDVGSALNHLEELRLAKREDQISRVPKWRHRFHHELLIKEPAMAVLATLMLRGPQTVSELRANAAPLNGPADIAGVQKVLDDLADRAQPLVAPMARQVGQSAQRVMHLLCGDIPAAQRAEGFEAPAAPTSERAQSLETRIAALEARMAEIERLIS
ncbi:MAG: YceH family protein [Panacagrimonas sp.]